MSQDGISPYFGALVGRVANRIADSTFQLDGKTYHVTPNENHTSLHGGEYGFSRHAWEGEPFTNKLGTGVELQYHSPDRDEVSGSLSAAFHLDSKSFLHSRSCFAHSLKVGESMLDPC